jgi:hypothetical protein
VVETVFEGETHDLGTLGLGSPVGDQGQPCVRTCGWECGSPSKGAGPGARLVVVTPSRFQADALFPCDAPLFELGICDRQYGSHTPSGCVANKRLANQKCVVLRRTAWKATCENDGDKNLGYVA